MDTVKLDQKLKSCCQQHYFSGVLRVTHRDAIQYEGSFGFANRVQGYNLIDDVLTPVEKSYDWMLGGDLAGRVDDVYCLNRKLGTRY